MKFVVDQLPYYLQSCPFWMMCSDLEEDEVFQDKYEIPSYFINLILKDYNMKVVGW